MIKRRLILCLSIACCIQTTNVQGDLEGSEKQGINDENNIRVHKKEIEEGHQTHSLSLKKIENEDMQQDWSSDNESFEEDIDLRNIAEEDIFVKYQTVIIMFCKAVNAELFEERRPPPNEINEILHNLKNMDTPDPEDKDTLDKIFTFAQNALYHYGDELLGIQRPYVNSAHYFRLLIWLKFRIRSKPDTPNKSVEPWINYLIQSRVDETQPKNLEILFPEAMEMFQEESLKINTLQELMRNGRGIDKIISLLIQLAENNGNINAIKQQELNIIPMYGQPGVNHKYCEKRRQNMEVILTGISFDRFQFQIEFGKEPEEILLYLNEAFRIICQIEYKRANAKEIDLKRDGDITSAKYFRDAMTLYVNALENKLLPSTTDEDTADATLRLENFPVVADEYDLLQIDALSHLSKILISSHYQQIQKNYDVQTKSLDSSFGAYYRRLIIWTYKQVSYIIPYEQDPPPLPSLLIEILTDLNVWNQSDTALNRSYVEISTLDALIRFCKTGTLSLSQQQPPSTESLHPE